MHSASILVVEDEAIIAADLAERLRRMGHAVADAVTSGESALRAAATEQPDLVLMDVVLKGSMTGIEAADKIRREHDIPIVFVSSHADAATIQRACGTEPFGYVLKPFNERELQAAIQIALYRHQAESKLRKVERWLATTLKSIGDAVIATDTKGIITLLNPMAEKLTGWRQDEAIGLELGEVFKIIDARTREPLDGLVAKALSEGFNIGLEEHVCLQARDGSETPIDDSIAPIRDESSNAVGTVVVFRDCSERKRTQEALLSLNRQLEHRVQERTAQLELANRELSAFTYSISHDLRAPLRAVNGFSQLLVEKYAEALDMEGRHFLQVVRRSSRYLSQMVDDFLRLFRVRNEPLHSRFIDMNRLLSDIVADLQAQRPDTPRIDVKPLPPAYGDTGLLRQVWVNLLSNAIKFSSKRAEPLIEVGGEEAGEEVRYYVKDNGSGFDMRYAGRLFGAFQRFHRADEFEGTGVGLAIVSRIVRMHDGDIRAESEVDAGATFFFTLPKRRAQADFGEPASHTTPG